MKLDNDTNKLISLFNQLFGERFNVEILSDRDEPIYLAATGTKDCNRIIFANGYFNSALHEISHWVIAGEQRRKREDYGYWYCADGRTAEEQCQFEKVEILPQAVERAFCEATGRRFSPSVDNLHSPLQQKQVDDFAVRIGNKLQQLQNNGFPPRASEFLDALTQEFS